MMGGYLTTVKVILNGKVIKTERWRTLLDSTEVKVNEVLGSGKTFDSLWDFIQKSGKGLLVPATLWERGLFSKKRRIEFFTRTETWVDNGEEREWSVIIDDSTPCKLTVEELKHFEVEKVIKYLKDCGLPATEIFKQRLTKSQSYVIINI